MSFRPAFWPTVFTIPAFIVLLGLGTWQLERLHWKTNLIAERDAALKAPPAALPRTIAEARARDFHPVRAEGEFLHDRELFVGAVDERGTTGFHVFTPLRLDDGAILLVNRGYIPAGMKDPATRTAGEVPGRVAVDGLVRLPPDGKPNIFVPDNRPDLNYWFYVEPPAMAWAAGLENVLPFYVDAGPAPNPGGWPRGGTTRLVLPNDHLQYAVTWYALAIGLAVIYVVYHRQRGEPAREPAR